MADFYAKEFVGVRDGTKPVQMADGRVVDAKKRCIRAVKDNTNALAAGDRVYVGRMPVGAVMKTFSIDSDTSLGTTTVSLGTTANPTKYVNAQTMTVTDRPTAIGPSAVAAALAPLADWEDIWVTLGVGGIAAAVNTVFNTEYTISA